MTSDEYVRLISTSSLFLRSTPAQQEELATALRSTVDSLGGTLLVDLRTTLVLATPRTTARSG